MNRNKLDGAWYLLEAIKLITIVIVFLIGWHLTPSWSRPGGDWTNVDPEVREWVKSLTVPNSTMSCCGEADAYEADLGEVGADGLTYAIITNTRGNPLPVGTKLLIPPEKIQNKQGNPTDHVIVFARSYDGYVYCYIPNGGV